MIELEIVTFTVLIPILLLASLVLFIVLSVRNRAKIKGKIGEFNIASRIKRLKQDEYKVLNNIILKTKNNHTVQIDHIIVSLYGIFVIETKNYEGWIFGNENAEKWMQIIFKEKYQFRNPIKQNWSHIYALKELLSDYSNVRYIPIVVFSGDGILKEITSSVYVIYDTEILRVIEMESSEKIISRDDILKIVSTIENNNIQNKEIEKEHVEDIQKTLMEKQLKKENLICPKCGNSLKLRNGKYGQFYGCTNYPYCHFTMKS